MVVKFSLLWIVMYSFVFAVIALTCSCLMQLAGPTQNMLYWAAQSPSHAAQLFCTAQVITNRHTNRPCDNYSSRLDFPVHSDTE